MDIRDLKRECNDLIDELETLQQTDANWIFGFRNYKIVWKNINSRGGDRLTKAAPHCENGR